MLAAGLVSAATASASAAPDWAADTMAKDAPSALKVANWWVKKNGKTNRLAQATAYTTETTPASTLKISGGYTPDGKPGVVAPIGEEKATTSVVKNVNLPKSIGKVFFVDAKNQLKWCSATSIQSKYRNLVATAGHCAYDDKTNSSVMDNWVFVPGYYQGKTPWGIYVGKTAYTHYDFSVYNDRDRDYAFVTVYNGIQVGGGTTKEVKKSEFDAAKTGKFVKKTPITAEQYAKGVAQYGEAGPYKSKDVDPKVETVAMPKDARDKGELDKYLLPNGHDGVKLSSVEVSEATYNAAPDGDAVGGKDWSVDNNSKYESKSQPVAISKDEYDALTAQKADGKFPLGLKLTTTQDDKKNDVAWFKQQFFVKKWIKSTVQTTYWVETYYLASDFIKDAGRLGDNVGGQGFTWNQKPGQTVYVFGYPAGAHPDGNKAFTGVTPKWCYGKTAATKYVSAADKVEEHVGLKCSMTTGSDGAPWLVKYSSAKRLGYVNGATSLFGDANKDGRIDTNTSAYFDGETAAVYNQAAAVWSGSIVTK
ncbi:trypsin-like serine peptidase [Streptosporangium lutulentum]